MAKMSKKTKTKQQHVLWHTVHLRLHNKIKKKYIDIYDTYSEIKHLYNLYSYALYLCMYKYVFLCETQFHV